MQSSKYQLVKLASLLFVEIFQYATTTGGTDAIRNICKEIHILDKKREYYCYGRPNSDDDGDKDSAGCHSWVDLDLWDICLHRQCRY